MRTVSRIERSRQVGFDLVLRKIIRIRELYAHAGVMGAFNPFLGNPDDFAGKGNLLRLIHQIEQNEDLFAQGIFHLCEGARYLGGKPFFLVKIRDG